jgi:hypothetical protein
MIESTIIKKPTSLPFRGWGFAGTSGTTILNDY